MNSDQSLPRQQIRLFILVIISLLFILSIALITVACSPATGYESSIYSSSPSLFWLVVFASISLVLLIQMIQGTYSISDARIKAGSVILLTTLYIAIINLWVIRGYYMWTILGDPGTHIGRIILTIINGRLPAEYIYPHIYYLLSILSLVADIDVISLHKLVPGILGILNVIFLLLFIRLTIPRDSGIIALIIGFFFMGGYYINLTPFHMGTLFFPLYLFVLTKGLFDRRVCWMFVLVLLIISSPLIHPILATVLIVIGATLILGVKMLNIESHRIWKPVFKQHANSYTFVVLLTLAVIWLMFWFSRFTVFNWEIENIISLFSDSNEITVLSSTLSKVSVAESYGYNVYEYIFRIYYDNIILIFSTIIYLTYSYFINRNHDINRLFYYLCFPIIFLSLAMILLYFTCPGFGPLRLLPYIVTISSGFFAYILYATTHKNLNYWRKLSCLGLLFMITISCVYTGVNTLYPSPETKSINYQTTKSEYVGMEWVLTHREIQTPLTGITVSPGRFAHLFFGETDIRTTSVPLHLGETSMIPKHFGYHENTSLAQSYSRETDFLITQRDKKMYVDVLPEVAKDRWYTEDFKRLNYDTMLNKMYFNGEFEMWHILK